MWDEFVKRSYVSLDSKLIVDWEGMGISDDFIAEMSGKMKNAFSAMEKLEAGAIANPTEERMVGHYWLRAPEIAPTKELQNEIENCSAAIKEFSQKVHSGDIKTEKGDTFKNVIVAGIGGSSLGPVFVYTALSSGNNKMKLYFLDNTDPDGMDTVFEAVESELDRTITVIISKSGGTIETRNCMEEARAFYEKHGLNFAKHAVCVTGEGSKLYNVAKGEDWLKIFPMWDWVGGRTSVMSAVGLVPLSLMGIDVDEFLKGGADCDKLTRVWELEKNPAAIMALSWYKCSGGKGGETMVVLPYRNSLELFAKYLQQLCMESLGKEHDNDGNKVNQGLAVLGNKGTSDQHSYVQQLVAGPENIFVTFIQVLRDRAGDSIIVGEESTSGDYLNAFMLGTKKALESHGKHTMTITVPDVNEYYVGHLIALFERAVGFYASLININAYDQPAVEFGKKAAGSLIETKKKVIDALIAFEGKFKPAWKIADACGCDREDAFRILIHYAANNENMRMHLKEPVWDTTFSLRQE